MKTIKQLLNKDERLASKVPESTRISRLFRHSNEAIENGAYFAIKGTQSDGHRYISDILSKAAAIIVENQESYLAFPKTILVPSTRHQYSIAASRWFGNPSKKIKLVGITGTNGKTTSTYLLKSLWNQLNRKVGVIGTIENHIGNQILKSTLTTPDALELQSLFSKMILEKVSHATMEVSSIALDQSRTLGCDFDVALFTNLTQDHLDYHGNLETYYTAKRKLFMGIKHAVINIDDRWGERLYYEADANHCYSFSFSRTHADFLLQEAKFTPHGTHAKIKTPAGSFTFSTPLTGKHNLYNCMGVLTTLFALGEDIESVCRLFEKSSGAPGRLERVNVPNGPYVFVDYAHTPDALLNVLSCLRDINQKARIITVFGCGGDRDKSKRPQMGKISENLSDITIVTSDNPRTENPEQIIDDIEQGIQNFHYREVDRKKAIHLALSLSQPEDILLIAGKGHENYQIIGKKYFPFDDRHIVSNYYHSN